MKVILSPIASNKTTTLTVDGLIITIDGTPIDLSIIPEGGEAEADENSPFIGKVTRDEVMIKYHYDSQLAESNQSTDWADYTFDITSGDVPCPIKWKGKDNV